ncbi:Oidioi.mRNA.OKI2018_I69.chr1.g1744.t1.cds [Oikopleura dioica]|uniref:Oidioi.mRNA.OKI2018_I69.chr1.g1744.t1.cds n=1 Tax=Oikopleura dioica TaxID=34765 RepID=A0ABN7SY09_OIKDI|nr:Oidioi.mRNA.OKI2018_I69.chr1.g1744.t1.cds [Oikopleura dioica]
MTQHQFCPLCGFLCANRPYARCKLKHRVHLYCLSAAPSQDCPHCGEQIIEELQPKPHYEIPAGIHGAITFPEEHLEKIYLAPEALLPISSFITVDGEEVGLVELIRKDSDYRWLQDEAEKEIRQAQGRMPTRVGSPGGLLLQISKMLMRNEKFQLTSTVLSSSLKSKQLKKAMLALFGPGIESTLAQAHDGRKPIEWAIFLAGMQEKQDLDFPEIGPLDILQKLLSFGVQAHFNSQSTTSPFEASFVSSVLQKFPELINATDDRGDSVFHLATKLKLTMIFHTLVNQKNCCFCENRTRKCEGLCRENLRNADGKTYLDLCRKDEVNETNVLQLLTSAGARKNKLPPHVISADLSRGREKTPVQIVNEFDTDPVPEFVYCTKTHFGGDAQIDMSVENMNTCSCGDVCDSEKCGCIALSEQVFYDEQGLLSAKIDFNEKEKCLVPVIYECSDLCGCDPRKCRNRATSKGVSFLMEVHKTREMGWGVRAREDIPRGAYIADYCGEMVTSASCEDREDSYLFDLGITNGSKFSYTIDAKRVGGFARFFNHKCNPNMIAIRVFREHQDFRFPNFAFFAKKSIKRGEELGFDYGDAFWKVKSCYFTCKCGWEKCKWSKLSTTEEDLKDDS